LDKIAFARITVLVSLSIQNFYELKNTENEILVAVKQMLEEKSGNIVIITHENPDGDAIGSAIGLAEVLINQGQNVIVITPNNYPQFLKWFSSGTEILIYNKNKRQAGQAIENADTIICVDFNEAKRAGKIEKLLLKSEKPKILVDHHPEPSGFCDYMISEPEYSSTSELIVDIVEKIGFGNYLNKNAAEALFTGIMTDTGSFSHNVSSANVFRIAANLMSLGIDTAKIQSNVYHNFSAKRMKLLGYCLNNKMEIFPEYRSAMISITKEELIEYNFEPGDTEGFVNYPLSVNNIVFSALFMEKDGVIKASFRSKGGFPANEFSKKHFEGGGHLNAAGGESKMSLDETIEKFRQLLGHYKNQLNKTEI
jgi:phosphoesterase RecJ-like protein